MKWENFLLGAFLLGVTEVLASEGEEAKEAVAEGGEKIPAAEDVATEETDDHENEDDIGKFYESQMMIRRPWCSNKLKVYLKPCSTKAMVNNLWIIKSFNSEHIDDIDELQNIINKKQYVLTYFFHPSCYPCMDFVPEFDKIPGRVKDLP